MGHAARTRGFHPVVKRRESVRPFAPLSFGMSVAGNCTARRTTAHTPSGCPCPLGRKKFSGHGGGQDHANRVGNALAGDLRRRTVDRLVEADAALAEAGGGQHAHRAGEN